MHYDFVTPAFAQELYALIETSDHVVITAHYSPDDDSIASVLSTYVILSNRYPGKDIRVIYTGPRAERFAPAPRFEAIEWVNDIANHLSECDLLIILDVNNIKRVSKAPELIVAKNIPTVIIDHHGSVPDSSTLSMIVPTMSSNAELVYRVFVTEGMLTTELAELFLLGILGDTANFSHVPPTQAGVLALGGELVGTVGVSIDVIRARYGGIPKQIIPLLQSLVANMSYVDIEGWPSTQYSWIDRATMEAGSFTDEDMSAASHIYMSQYLTKVKGQPWGIVATPRQDGGVRISGRSQPGSVNVRDLFERMGIGGGHDRASGANIAATNKPVDGKDGITAVLSWMKDNKPLIN